MLTVESAHFRLASERERDFFEVITMSKYVLKIIYSALQFVRFEASSYIVITDLLFGAPFDFVFGKLRLLILMC